MGFDSRQSLSLELEYFQDYCRAAECGHSGFFLERVLKTAIVSERDFSRAERATKPSGALAPSVFVFSNLQFRSG
jgi:hypothetical protein